MNRAGEVEEMVGLVFGSNSFISIDKFLGGSFLVSFLIDIDFYYFSFAILQDGKMRSLEDKQVKQLPPFFFEIWTIF